MSKSRSNLRALRKALRITTEELAEAAELSRQGYWLIENGGGAARPMRMVKINEFLRIARAKRIQVLESEIAYLKGFKIDESLYLTDDEMDGDAE